MLEIRSENVTFYKSRGCPFNGHNTNAGKRLRMINRSISKRDSFRFGDVGRYKSERHLQRLFVPLQKLFSASNT